MAETSAWVTAISTIALFLATVGLGVVALFGEQIRARFQCPRLSVSITAAPPDCLKAPLGLQYVHPESDPNTGPTLIGNYALRLRVSNDGETPAENIEVIADELQVRNATGQYVRVPTFIPVNLVWASMPGRLMYLDRISPGTHKHCDLAHIVDPQARASLGMEDNPALAVPANQTMLSFDAIVRPYNLNYLVGPGQYRLTVLIVASNSAPITRTVEINLTGKWSTVESEMLSGGIGLSVLQP